MSKLMIALGMGGAGKEYCPDCGCELKSNGCCSDCGYGEDDMEDDGEEEGDGEESAQVQAILDIKNELQRVMEKIDRLIVNGD